MKPKFNPKTEDKRRLRTDITTRVPLVRICKHLSKRIEGCPRPNIGSFSFFVEQSILRMCYKMGVDVQEINPDEYVIRKILPSDKSK